MNIAVLEVESVNITFEILLNLIFNFKPSLKYVYRLLFSLWRNTW